MYGFSVAPELASLTLAEHLSKVFKARAVVGDRTRLTGVELVVREMQGKAITKVGLRFAQPER